MLTSTCRILFHSFIPSALSWPSIQHHSLLLLFVFRLLAQRTTIRYTFSATSGNFLKYNTNLSIHQGETLIDVTIDTQCSCHYVEAKSRNGTSLMHQNVCWEYSFVREMEGERERDSEASFICF